MARHRNVRTMKYEDEYFDEDDIYGHSVEDSYCVSPGTAAQFTFNRERNVELASYMDEEGVIPEEDEEGLEGEGDTPSSTPRGPRGSLDYTRPQLNDIDEAKLNSCLEEIRNIVGEAVPEHVLVDTIMKHNFSLETSLNELLSQQEAPKPQRQPRQRRNRSQELDEEFDSVLYTDSPTDGNVFTYSPMNVGPMKFDASCSPHSSALTETTLTIIAPTNNSHSTSLGKSVIQSQCSCTSASSLDSDSLEVDFSGDFQPETTLSERTESDLKISSTKPLLSTQHKTDLPFNMYVSPKHTEKLSGTDSLISIQGEVSKKQGLDRTSEVSVRPHNLVNQGSSIFHDENKQEGSLQNVTLTNIACGGGSNRHETVKNENISLGDLIKLKYPNKSDLSTPCMPISDISKVSESKPCIQPKQSLSLAGVANLHKPQQKPDQSINIVSLADTAKLHKSTTNEQPKQSVSLADMAKLHNTNIKEPKQSVSLSGLSQLQKSTRNELSIKQSLSLTYMAKLDKTNIKESASLTELAQMHKPTKNEQTKQSMSLADMAKLHKSTTNEQPKSSLLADMAKLQEPEAQSVQSVPFKSLSDLAEVKTAKPSAQGTSLHDLVTSHSGTPTVRNGISLSLLANTHLTKSGAISAQSGLPQTLTKREMNSEAGHTNENVKGNKISLLELAKTRSKQPTDMKSTCDTKVKDILARTSKVTDQNIIKLDRISAGIDSIPFTQNEEIFLEFDINSDENKKFATKFESGPSILGRTLCMKFQMKKENKLACVIYKQRRLSYQRQIKGVATKSPVHVKRIVPFGFDTPSPDDIIKERQRGAFTRTGERTTSSPVL